MFATVLLLFLPVFYLPLLAQFDAYKTCFCKVGEAIDYCDCNSESIDVFNNIEVYHAIQAILQKEPLKFYKVIDNLIDSNKLNMQVNMAKPCPFWSDDDGQCSSKECTIGYCDEEVPVALRKPAILSVAHNANEPNASVCYLILHLNFLLRYF